MSLLTNKLKELISTDFHSKDEKGDLDACIISICSQKGGVGKTTTAVNLGTALARFFKKKVLICDLDPQGHVEKSIARMIPEGIEYVPLSTILMKKKGNLLDAIIPTHFENLSITPGDKNLYETENLLSTKIGKEFFLQDGLRIVRTQYDFIIFDCPPTLGNLTLNALVASNYCVVPCEMSLLSFEGVSDLMETMELIQERLNPKLSLLGIIKTRVDVRSSAMNAAIEENLKKYFKGKIFETPIHTNTAINKAHLEGKSVFDFAPSSTGAEDYEKLSREIMKKLNRKSIEKEDGSLQKEAV